MKATYWVLGAAVLGLVLFYSFNNYIYQEKQGDGPQATSTSMNVQITPLSHASLILSWDTAVVYADPTDAAAYAGQPAADIVLVTHEHGDHFSTSTLAAVVGSSTMLIVPQSVADKLPAALKARATVLKNGEATTTMGVRVEAVPAYNLRQEALQFHPKGRDNGYVIESGGERVYVAGDTEDTSEMRALADIDVAFLPMNLPYTMTVEQAAQATLAFKPKIVYPYHYREQEGLADTAKFKQLVNAGNADIEVALADWYAGE